MRLDIKDILQPELTDINRLPSRASYTPFTTGEEALQQNSSSSLCRSLDGEWEFLLADRPGDAPAGWEGPSHDTGGWRSIVVPGSWTCQGTSDLPQYTNVQMPFSYKAAPEIPDENPTGLYRTSFDLPADWKNRKTILHVGGFESVALLWCNGKFVGMGKDSRLPSEFDLSPHLVEGSNLVAIMVIKWSDATWIEDQDHWYHGGLHRSVYLQSRGATHIADLSVTADFDPETGSGKLHHIVKIDGASAGWKVRGQLLGPDDSLIAKLDDSPVIQFPDGSVFEQYTAAYSFVDNRAELNAEIEDVQPWSSETPVLYKLVTELVDDKGNVTEANVTSVGFRRIEVRDRQLLINGKPIVIIGVNRHDHHPETGKTSTVEEMREELLLMRRHNINAIRTAHYPNDHRLLDLCDELGFYVIDEANVECHARWQAVSNDLRYQKTIVERVMRMVYRDRNHASVIGWSLGNESGLGPAHDAAAAMVRRIDNTRFLHYEGAIFHRFQTLMGDPTESSRNAPDMRERMTTDLICPMYPSIDFIVGWARWAEETKLDDRPMILCEFSHAMGNSNGSIADYVDAFFAEPALGGGFVWEWRDHGFAMTDDEGRFFWAYGGHFGDDPNDVNFCCDGLVGPDLTPHPGLREYQWAARPVRGEWIGPGEVRFTNRRAFTGTDDLELTWTLQKNGVAVESGTFRPDIPAGQSAVVAIDHGAPTDNDAEWHLLTQWALRRATPWAKAGHMVGWDQFDLTAKQHSPAPAEQDFRLAGSQRVTGNISVGPVKLGFDEEGRIASVDVNGRRIVDGDITATLWRAPMDNDGGKIGWREERPSKRMEWVNHGLDKLKIKASPAQFVEQDGRALLDFERSLMGANGEQAAHRSRWTLDANGARVDEEIIVPEAWIDLPRVGIRFTVPAGLEELAWLGLGPDESYPDRIGAQTVGLWTSRVTDQYHPYVLPQEHGAHEQTRSFTLKDQAEQGFEIGLPSLSFSARHHHDADISKATTIADVIRRDSVEVHISAAMRGVGTGACGPDALPAYRVGPGKYTFHWFIRPL
ncbi:glycoside hydrolase family 2 TIM barrel-domain containing protein [Sphingorhabdus sp. EL138]|uniref:glycoside hydrolase family 2 TIM barrel-domain containing protein n=1 Tax=Sphingorhabdus sp. EL138 TaxID=2073156 RepID=UPI000D69E9A9|nr:glycoside hydrolase family 2 TIM barrel-domain containing protein [Sphingorhabdus sp. EL138]